MTQPHDPRVSRRRKFFASGLDKAPRMIEHMFDHLSGQYAATGLHLSDFGTCRSSSEGCAVPAILSDPVADVAATVDKLCADDRLITSPDMLLGDIESLL